MPDADIGPCLLFLSRSYVLVDASPGSDGLRLNVTSNTETSLDEASGGPTLSGVEYPGKGAAVEWELRLIEDDLEIVGGMIDLDGLA